MARRGCAGLSLQLMLGGYSAPRTQCRSQVGARLFIPGAVSDSPPSPPAAGSYHEMGDFTLLSRRPAPPPLPPAGGRGPPPAPGCRHAAAGGVRWRRASGEAAALPAGSPGGRALRGAPARGGGGGMGALRGPPSRWRPPRRPRGSGGGGGPRSARARPVPLSTSSGPGASPGPLGGGPLRRGKPACGG